SEALPRLLEIYVRAMGYPRGTIRARSSLWLDHSRRPDFRCVVAVVASHAPGRGSGMRDGYDGYDGYDAVRSTSDADEPAPIVGFGYGYRGARGQWWHDEVARGLGTHETAWLANYFELTELHVDP